MKPRTPECLAEDCPTCGAKAGLVCRRPNGKRHLRRLHDQRVPLPPAWVPPVPPKPRAPRVKVDFGPQIWRRSRPYWGGRTTVYLIETIEGPARVKIGVAQNVDARLQSLRCGSPVKLRLRASWTNLHPGVEWDLHQLARPHWLHGEWFTADAIPVVETYMDGDAKATA